MAPVQALWEERDHEDILTRRAALLLTATCAATFGLVATCRSANLDQDRLRDFEDRPEHRRRRGHHDSELRTVGEGSERRRRHQARRQARADRGRAVRRPLQRRRSRARAGAPDQPGQGRFHPAALGHRPQPRGRSDAEQAKAIRTSPRQPSPTARRNWQSAGPTVSGCSAPAPMPRRRWSNCCPSCATKRRSATPSRWSASPTALASICRRPARQGADQRKVQPRL